MLLRSRVPRIDSLVAAAADGFEHLDKKSIALLRWLKVNRIEFVLVGPVGLAIRTRVEASGPVSIVPAPYGRNLDRLLHALDSEQVRLRFDGRAGEETEPKTMQAKLTAEKLVGAQRWTLRCGDYDLDVEGRPRGVPRYQELLYESGRFQPAAELSVEVASPEDIEHYEHVRRSGVSPELRITRAAPVEQT